MCAPHEHVVGMLAVRGALSLILSDNLNSLFDIEHLCIPGALALGPAADCSFMRSLGGSREHRFKKESADSCS